MKMGTKLSKTLARMLALFVVLSLLPIESIQADSSYTYSDTSSSTKVTTKELVIYEQHMVWVANDAKGQKQVFYKNLVTGIEKQITNIASPKQSPNITETSKGDLIIIWTDKNNRDFMGREWDLYAYNLNADKLSKMNSMDGHYVRPSVSGDMVVWHDPVSFKMYTYDLVNELETYIGEGSNPVIANQKIVYKIKLEGGLNLHDITTNETKNILDLPYGSYATWFTFNGRYVLVMQGSMLNDIVYRKIDTMDAAPSPVDLSPVMKANKIYLDMAIGDNYAAWVEDKNGVAQVMGANLTNGQAFQMTHGTSDQTLFSFSGDQLITKGNDGNLLYKTIVPQNVTVIADTPTIENPVEKSIGPDGGIAKSDTGEVTLHIPKNTFKGQTTVTIEQNAGVIKKSENILPNKLSFVDAAWDIKATNPFEQNPKLSMTYDKGKIIPQQTQKLGIYQFDSESLGWNYIGGKADPNKGTIEVSITDQGVYAVMIYDRTFNDIQGHWASSTIEILASRWIVNGTSETMFSPEMQLTRAQFAKMLVASMGVIPVPSANPTFVDVTTTHWGYEWIEAAAQAGWVEGDQGKFRPNEILSREQMMIMMIRAVGLESTAIALTKEEIDQILSFKDSSKISSWARPYVAATVKFGLIQGSNGQVLPIDTSNRAQAAAVVYRLLVYLDEI